jgi:putative DNA-invertase from lambdoid prophage Rac
MKAAIYCRVSTADQSCEMQLEELRRVCAARGFQIHKEYVDHGISGMKAKRPALDRLMADARARQFDIVICWRLDRFGRSTSNVIANVQELRSIGVRWIATSQGLDTDQNNPMANFFLHVMAAFAELERDTIRERVVLGVRTARDKGKTLGRPKRVFRRDQAREMRQAGASWTTIARELAVPVGTVREACR